MNHQGFNNQIGIENKKKVLFLEEIDGVVELGWIK
jgi:hypothetical protein